jgi:hypothetical protein
MLTSTEGAQAEVITEQSWHDLCVIVAHDPVTAAEQTSRRNERIAALIMANAWADKLDAQDLGETHRGRPLSDRGATARLYHAVAEARLSRIIKVDLKSPVLRYHIDWKARALAELMGGKLLLVTNATDLTAPAVVDRYKALADIERGFRVLKSEIDIGPVYHRLPEHIRAHAQICFMAVALPQEPPDGEPGDVERDGGSEQLTLRSSRLRPGPLPSSMGASIPDNCGWPCYRPTASPSNARWFVACREACQGFPGGPPEPVPARQGAPLRQPSHGPVPESRLAHRRQPEKICPAAAGCFRHRRIASTRFPKYSRLRRL